MAATATFLQATFTEDNFTEYTFSSQNFGTASADRYIVALIGSWRFNNTNSISSVTIGGVSATITEQVTVLATHSGLSGMAIAAVPTGTSGDVVITLAGGATRCSLALYSVTGIDGVTAYDSDNGTGNDPSASVNVPAGGVCIAGGFVGATTSVTWTGLTEDFDNAPSHTYSGAHDEFVAAQTPLAVSYDAASSNQDTLVVASWSPSATIAPVAAQYYRRRRIN